MGRFGPRERTEFLALKTICYDGLESSDLLARLGARLADCLEADGTCMVQLDPATTLLVYVVSQGWADDAHQPLIEHALLRTPTADPGRLVEQKLRTVVTEALVPTDQPYNRDPYFVHHILWGGYRHELQTMCASRQRGQALLTLTRRAATGSFEPRQIRLLDALAPHVAAGMHAATVRKALAAPATSNSISPSFRASSVWTRARVSHPCRTRSTTRDRCNQPATGRRGESATSLLRLIRAGTGRRGDKDKPWPLAAGHAGRAEGFQGQAHAMAAHGRGHANGGSELGGGDAALRREGGKADLEVAGTADVGMIGQNLGDDALHALPIPARYGGQLSARVAIQAGWWPVLRYFKAVGAKHGSNCLAHGRLILLLYPAQLRHELIDQNLWAFDRFLELSRRLPLTLQGVA